MTTTTTTPAARPMIASKVTPDLIKYATICANEREFGSVQKLSCADVRGLLAERAALRRLVTAARFALHNPDELKAEIKLRAALAAIRKGAI